MTIREQVVSDLELSPPARPRPRVQPVESVDANDARLPRFRAVISLWAPFDHSIAFGALGLAGTIVALRATPTPVWVIGALVAVIGFSAAARLFLREFCASPEDRGTDVRVDEVDGGR